MPDSFFAPTVDEFLYSTVNVGAPVGGVQSYLIEARALVELADLMMRAVASGRKTLRTT